MLVIRVCGGVEVEADGRLLPASLLAGRQGRLVLAYLACERHRAVPREELAELLWPEDLPASWTSSLHAVVSRLRKLLVEAGLDGGEALTSAGGAYRLVLPDDAEVDWELAHAGIADAERAVVTGDGATAVAAASRASAIAGRGFLADDGAWADEQQEVARDLCVRAALAAAEGHLLEGKPARAVEAAREALGRDPLREAAFRVLMRALAAAGERAEALRVWERCRTTLVEELGVDPSPETEAVYLAVLHGGEPQEPAPAAAPAAALTALPSGVVTFLLTDIVESTVMWERHPAAMAAALERHDALVAEVVAAHGGTMLKSKLEGDATVSVFSRATAGALAALALRDALGTEPWPEDAAPKLRMAMHTGEAFERDGDYFGPALNRAARLRGLAGAGQVLLSQAVAELVRDHLPEGVALADRGHRDLRGLSRGENVYELAPADELEAAFASTALERPPLPPPLASAGPFVGRGDELARLAAVWERAARGEPQALLLAGEPGVGKSRLAAECARAAHDAGGLVLYGRCDEELGAPLQPFIEALRTLAPALGPSRLRAVRGIDELSRLVPELGELLPDAAPAARADPDSERYALFDATTELLCAASAEAPTLVVLDDLHWAGKTTLSLLRHLLRNAKDARLLVLGTYRDTELARTHPLAALLADLRRDRAADKLTLTGLEPEDVAAYLRAVGNPDRALGRELAEVTSGNPFFLIEALRHVEETGGRWEPGSLPEGVREATGRRLSQLSDATNEALSVAAVTGTTFDLALVERVSDVDVLDALGEAVQAGLIIEEPGAPGRFRFAHALVRQVLLAELVTIKRLRLHRTIAELLEAEPGPDPDVHLTDLAHHWFECALTGGGEKAVDACRRAADRARERLAYEEAGDLYGMAIQALDATEQVAEDDVAALHLARCDALLTAGDVTAARGAIDALGRAAQGSDRLTAWHTTYAGQLAVLAEPDRLDEIVASIGDAAAAMHAAGDLTGEATARYVHALALERLGRIGAAQRALDEALAAARTADDRRLADAILAEVPPAALWGPSPVTRASGNCLDVVRVLRITDGAPAVESVALRCQAVLEALRGRMDAARRMVASARRTVDQLGLVHRRLETDVSAGFIELLDRQAEAAEAYLRPAYEELRDRGLGGEAAQAAALLGRALLMQGRDDEAEAAAQEAEQLAGADLKAAIAWRDVRAEAAARRGDMALALDLAREAVELATATDALLLVADARLALATVLRASGDLAAARAEAARAIEVCDAKGATALAEGARARAGEPAAAPAASAERPARRAMDALLDNAAARSMRRLEEAWAGGSWDAIAAYLGGRWDLSDVRRVARVDLPPAESVETLKHIFDGGTVPSSRPIALRGERLALYEMTWTGAAPEFEATMLHLYELDDALEPSHSILWEPGELPDALEELDRRFVAGEAAEHAAIFDTCTRMVAALNARDWDLARTAIADEFTVRDHRTTSVASTPLTAEQWVAYWADVAGVWGNAELRIAHVPRLSDAAAVWVLTLAGEGVDTHGPSERWWIQVWAHDGTRATGLDVFDDDRYADALARFEELSTPAQDFFESSATRAIHRFFTALNAGAVETAEASLAPTFRLDDRRAIVGAVIEGEGLVRLLRYIVEGKGTIGAEILATRGDHLVLARAPWEGPQGEIDLLLVARSDAEGRADYGLWFDAHDLDAAYDELDRLYQESGGIAPSGFLTHVSARDWEGAAALLASDCVIDDHRPARFGRLEGREQIVDFYRSTVAVTPDIQWRAHHLRATDRVGLGQVSVAGELEGARYEVGVVSVIQRDEQDRITNFDFYDEADLRAAVARFQELVAEQDARAEDGCPDRFVNAAVRAARRLAAAIHQDDVDLAEASFSPAFQLDDRRALVGLPVDSDAHDRSIRYIIAGRGEVTFEVLATRGDRLGLTRATWVGDQGEIPLLIVLRADDQDRYDAAVWFDPDDLDAAYQELDRQYVELGAAPLFLKTKESVDALNARDWDAVEGLLAPDSVVDDHRPIQFGVLEGSAAFLDFQRSTAELTPDARLVVHHHLEEGGIGLRVMSLVGTIEGAPFENEIVAVHQVDEHGRVARRDFYAPEQLDAALAHYDELLADQARTEDDGCPERFVNAAVRAGRVLVQVMNDGDVEGTVRCFTPDGTFQDRRSFFQLTADAASSEMREGLRFLLGGRGKARPEVLATRGDGLSLTRSTWAMEGAEATIHWIAQADDQDRLEDVTWFDADDLDAAYAELHRRHLERGADALYLAEHRAKEAIDARDWDALEAMLAPDCVSVDHRRARFGVVRGSRAYVDLLRSGVELSPDIGYVIHHHLAEGRIALSVISRAGTVEGGPFQNLIVDVSQQDTRGLVAQRDFYGDDQLDEALARYDELRSGLRDADPFAVSNLATQNSDRFVAALQAGDRDALVAVFAPGFVATDRRRFSQVEAAGSTLYDWLLDPDALIELTGTTSWSTETEILATRGERLALGRTAQRFGTDTSPLEREFLVVLEVDEAGRRTEGVLFDLDDLDAAYAELDSRHGESSPLFDGMRAFEAHDWDGFAALFEDGAAVHDHRTVGWGPLDVLGLVARYRMTTEMSPDARARMYHVLDRAEGASLAALGVEGTHDGGAFERRFLAASAWRPDGRFTAWEIYDLEDVERARTRFAELVAEAEGHRFTNAAMRNGDEFLAAWRGRDWDAAMALHAEDFVGADHRGSAQVDGLTAEQDYRLLFELDETEFATPVLIATRGDRLALVSGGLRFSDGESGLAQVDFLYLIEVDETGLRTGSVLFDADDLEAAYDELDRRYVAQGGHDIGGIGRAAAAGDLEGLAAQLTPSFHIVDHRVLGMAGASRRGYLRDIREMGELAPDNRIEVHHVLATNPLAVHSLCRVYGTYEGGEFETPIVFVGGFSSGERWWVWELYGEDQLDEARARYGELADPSAIIPNLAERTLEQLRERYDERDWDGIGGICAEGFVFEDRGTHVQGGRDMFLDNGRALAEQGATLRRELLAAPGDRVCLVRRSAGDDDSFVMEHLQVVEVDDEGSFTAFVTFEGEDRAGASIEVARRQGAIAGAPPAVFAFIAALNTHDVDGVRASLARCRFEDHRRGRPGVLNDLDDYFKTLEAGFALTESLVAEQLRHFAEGPHGTVTLTRTYGLREGGDLETLFISVVCWDDEALTNLAVYECEDLEQALARFDELRPPST